jgi:excisionase family DNA binding protein
VSDYLTLEEAADLLRIHWQTLRRLLKRGRVPGRKLGNQWRISRAALDAWINRNNP